MYSPYLMYKLQKKVISTYKHLHLYSCQNATKRHKYSKNAIYLHIIGFLEHTFFRMGLQIR